jgi:hypothetical protein
MKPVVHSERLTSRTWIGWAGPARLHGGLREVHRKVALLVWSHFPELERQTSEVLAGGEQDESNRVPYNTHGYREVVIWSCSFGQSSVNRDQALTSAN